MHLHGLLCCFEVKIGLIVALFAFVFTTFWLLILILIFAIATFLMRMMLGLIVRWNSDEMTTVFRFFGCLLILMEGQAGQLIWRKIWNKNRKTRDSNYRTSTSWSVSWKWSWFHNLFTATASISDWLEWLWWWWSLFFTNWFENWCPGQTWNLNRVGTWCGHGSFIITAAHIFALISAIAEIERWYLERETWDEPRALLICCTFPTCWMTQTTTARIKTFLIFMIFELNCCTWSFTNVSDNKLW